MVGTMIVCFLLLTIVFKGNIVDDACTVQTVDDYQK